jgi:hypothetical protein
MVYDLAVVNRREVTMTSICITLFLLANLLPAHSSVSSQTRAFLTNVKGTVKVKQRGKPEVKVTEGEALLYDDDIVKISDDGEALLWQAYSRILRLTPKTSKRIAMLPPSSGPEILSFNDYLKCEKRILDSFRDIRKPSALQQGGEDQPDFRALTPRFSSELSPRPTFEWTALQQATSYEFALYHDDEHNTLIWAKTTGATRLVYPDHKEDKSARELKPGKYRWEVFANIDRNIKRYASTRFTIVTAEEAAKIQTDLSNASKLVREPAATNLIYIVVCLEYQQYPEAEKALNAAVFSRPHDQMLRALLMYAYEKMERPDEREDLRAAFDNLDIIEVGKKFRIDELLRAKK